MLVFSSIRFSQVLRTTVTVATLSLMAVMSQAQVRLFLTPSTTTAAINDLITLDLKLQNGTDITGFGTQVSLNTSFLQFQPDFGGTNTPFKITAGSPFNQTFENSLSGTNNDTLRLALVTGPSAPNVNNANTTITLGQFQVKLLSDPGANGTPVNLADVGVFRSEVNNGQGQNLLDVSVGGAGSGVAGAVISTGGSAVPGPEAWLLFAGGQSGLMFMVRRRKMKKSE